MQRVTLRSVHLVSVVVVFTMHLLALNIATVSAIEPSILLRETDGRNVAPGQQGCPLEPSLTGDCANLRYYNLCSGYIWIYSILIEDEGVGVYFEDSCLVPGNGIDKAITYFRNVLPGYSQTVDVFLDISAGTDSCPDYVLSSHLDLDPGLRWNCSPFQGLCVPVGAMGVIVRTQHHGGGAPTIATDRYSAACNPDGAPNSFYYGLNASQCVPWRVFSPTGTNDNLLYWLIVDGPCQPSAVSNTSWGALKGLYR
jgi:hypothetical protein